MGSSHSSENDHAAQAFADFMVKNMDKLGPSTVDKLGFKQCGPVPDNGPFPLDSAVSIDRKHCCHFTPDAIKKLNAVRDNPDNLKDHGEAAGKAIYGNANSWTCQKMSSQQQAFRDEV